MTFRLETKVVEEVDAWVECSCGDGREWIGPHYDESRQCPNCQGSGGRWHEAVHGKEPYQFGSHFIYLDSTNAHMENVTSVPKVSIVLQTSKLVREHEVCSFIGCNGTGEHVKYGPEQFFMEDPNMKESCKHCEGTGAEPNTASPWRVL